MLGLMMMMLKCFCWWCGHKMTTMDLISSPHHVVVLPFSLGRPIVQQQSLQCGEATLTKHTKKKHRINCKKFSTAAAPHTHSSCGTEHACIYVAAASPLSTNIHCTRGNDTEHVDKFKSYKFYLSSLEIFLYCWKMCDSTLLYCEIGRSFFAVCCVCQRHTFTTYGNCDSQQQSSEMAKKNESSFTGSEEEEITCRMYINWASKEIETFPIVFLIFAFTLLAAAMKLFFFSCFVAARRRRLSTDATAESVGRWVGGSRKSNGFVITAEEWERSASMSSLALQKPEERENQFLRNLVGIIVLGIEWLSFE